MSDLLRLENVHMVFQARTGLLGTTPIPAVNGVSLSIGRGETVAVVGESGSGKTTLGRLCLRLLRPTSGRIAFDGEDITHLAETRLKAFRRRAQGIFQDPFSSLDPYMDVQQTLEEPLIIHGDGSGESRRGKVEWALEEVKLTPAAEFAGKYPHMLSGGQRQRVAIARALILQPQFVLADEPVSMIDASSRVELLSLLSQLQQRHGMSFLYITHDITTARHFSQRIVVMYLGHIVEEGPTQRVIADPLHPYTRGLLAAVPEPDPSNRLRERSVIPGEPPSPAKMPPACPFHPRCPSFMKGTCDVVKPQLQEVRPAQKTACHLYE